MGLNLICALALFLSFISSYISPAMAWLLALCGLAFPFLVFINIFFCLFWIIRRRYLALISMILLVLSYNQILSTFQVHFQKSFERPAPALKIMSYNVPLFDLYNSTHDKSTRDQILDLVVHEKPDILCLQECYAPSQGKYNALDTLLRRMNALDSGRVYSRYNQLTPLGKQGSQTGSVIFTCLPVSGEGRVPYPSKSRNISSWTDVIWNRDTLRLFDIHLQSIGFSLEDYQFIAALSEDTTVDDMQGSLHILSRVNRAFIKRSHQADAVAEAIAQSPHPVLVCGDFNDTPASYAYTKISNNLVDAFRESGYGFAKSYAGAFPSFRIDFILHDRRYAATGYHSLRARLSDHYPIVAYLFPVKK